MSPGRAFLKRNSTRILWTVACALMITSIGLVWHSLNELKKERAARIENQDKINCSLARLVDASSSGSPFGAGIDQSKLTPFDARVLGSIGKVLVLTKDTATKQTVTFSIELGKLKNHTTCAVPAKYARNLP